MKIGLLRQTCGAAAIVILAGCGFNSTPLGPVAPGLSGTLKPAAVTYKTLYDFSGKGKNGASPYAPLIAVNGTMYGTASLGGANTFGTAFSITTSGKEATLHSFEGYDGVGPDGGLLYEKGLFYGTTIAGGSSGSCGSSTFCGTVFAMTPAGKVTVLHSFSAGADGAEPEARLVDVKGTLYGTTLVGGVHGVGTVYSITPSGKERVLHSFGSSGDGLIPYAAGLVDVDGVLYGTTELGGNGGCSAGCGTVFSITASGTEKVLYNFAGGTDGAGPTGDLMVLNGTIYGTTTGGGATSQGTVFSITPSGTEAVLYSFAGGKTDGSSPQAGLTNVNGTLYGTTDEGGASNYGTVFSLTLSGKENVLHSFGRYGDGEYPSESLLYYKGALYGITPHGGTHFYGTVFSLKP